MHFKTLVRPVTYLVLASLIFGSELLHAEPKFIAQQQTSAVRFSSMGTNNQGTPIKDRLPSPARAIPSRAYPIMVFDFQKKANEQKLSSYLGLLPAKYGELKRVPSSNLSQSNALVFKQNSQLTTEMKKNIGGFAQELTKDIEDNAFPLTKRSEINPQGTKDIALLKAQLSRVKNKVFNKKLQAFDLKVQMFHEGAMSIRSYIHLLSEMKDKKTAAFTFHPDIEFFLKASELEEKINFKMAEKEQRRLIDQLEFRINDNEFKNFINTALKYRLGEIKHTDFYSYLQSISLKSGIKLEAFPALRDYMRYVFMSENVNAEKLFIQLQQLENKRYDSLISKPEERSLVEQTKFVIMAKKLVDFSLSSEEWANYPLSGKDGFQL